MLDKFLGAQKIKNEAWRKTPQIYTINKALTAITRIWQPKKVELPENVAHSARQEVEKSRGIIPPWIQ